MIRLNWLVLLFCCALALSGCKASDVSSSSDDDDSDSSSSSGYDSYHTANKGGTYHGEDYEAPGKYCASGGCHGDDLLGGDGPSCYSCHGAKWEDEDHDHDSPDEDHDVLKGGYYHAEDPDEPWDSCDDGDCHGSDLKGGEDGPSCFTCHGQKWDDKPSDDDAAKDDQAHD